MFKSFFSLQIPERNAEGGHGKDAMRIKDFTYDFSFWSVDKNEPKYCSQKQVCSIDTFMLEMVHCTVNIQCVTHDY